MPWTSTTFSYRGWQEGWGWQETAVAKTPVKSWKKRAVIKKIKFQISTLKEEAGGSA
jgi:hypothetical protein